MLTFLLLHKKLLLNWVKMNFQKQIKDFSVKKQSTIDVNKDIAAIKTILDTKSGNDLIIILPSNSTGNIISKMTNKNEIEKKLRILIDPSNTNGEANHESLRGTSIEVSMNADAPISTTPQNIIVSISKTGGKTLSTSKTFQVKRNFTLDEDIKAIWKILNGKTGQDLIITLPSDSTGRISDNQNAIRKNLRILIDSSNTSGDPNHPSLRGTYLGFNSLYITNPISTTPKYINVEIGKRPGKTLFIENKFQVKKG